MLTTISYRQVLFFSFPLLRFSFLFRVPKNAKNSFLLVFFTASNIFSLNFGIQQHKCADKTKQTENNILFRIVLYMQ